MIRKTLIILLISMAYRLMNAQCYSNHSPIFEDPRPGITSPAMNGYAAPFSAGKNSYPTLRAGDKNDTGDNLINTGGTDGNGNQNDIPVGDGVVIIIVLTLGYAVYSRKYRSKVRKSIQ